MLRRYGSIALLVVAAATAGYFAGRAREPASAVYDLHATRLRGALSSPATSLSTTAAKTVAAKSATSSTAGKTALPLPPPGTPLKQSRSELQERADAGDAEAASRLYQDTQRCSDVRRINLTSAMTAKVLSANNTVARSADDLRGEQRLLDRLQKDLDFAHANAALCAGLSDEEINQLIPVSLQAAQLGDNAAADCYVGGALYGAIGLLDHPEWITDYKQNALGIAQRAVESGDWRMVNTLRFAYSSNFGISLLSQLTGHDDVQAYRYLKLSSLGKPPNQGMQAWIAKTLAAETATLPADARSEAEAWAQDTFNRYFGSNPTDTSDALHATCRSQGL